MCAISLPNRYRNPPLVSGLQQRRGNRVLISERAQQGGVSSRVNLGSPQRNTAAPPMKQKRHPCDSKNACRSRAASKSPLIANRVPAGCVRTTPVGPPAPRRLTRAAEPCCRGRRKSGGRLPACPPRPSRLAGWLPVPPRRGAKSPPLPEESGVRARLRWHRSKARADGRPSRDYTGLTSKSRTPRGGRRCRSPRS